MGQLAFTDEDRLFDRECVRFTGVDGPQRIVCGVTAEALKQRDAGLPHHGLIPAEAFLAAYERLMIDIHEAARAKYQRGEFEPQGEVRVMVRRRDLR